MAEQTLEWLRSQLPEQYWQIAKLALVMPREEIATTLRTSKRTMGRALGIVKGLLQRRQREPDG